MLDPRAEYLDALQAVLAEEAEPAVARAVRAEIAAHLDAAIQARLELGEVPELAMEQAVAALGSPKVIAAGVARVHDGFAEVDERRALYAGWGVAALVSAFLMLVPVVAKTNTDLFLRSYAAIGLSLLALIAFFSFRCRRPLPLPFLTIALAAGAGVWGCLSTIWIDPAREGGMGTTSRWEAQTFVRQARSEIRTNGSFMHLLSGQLDGPVADIANRESRRRQVQRLQARNAYLEEQSAATLAAMARTVPERMSATLPEAVGTTAAVWAITMTFNAGGAFLGRVWRARRRGREVARA
ncbi:MAG: HAAS signaling domain-containing protein [Fimbriimonas sp.]